MPSENPIQAVISGGREARAALAAIDKQVDVATLAALKKVQQVTKTSVRSGMRGRPRWDRRGKIGNGGASVNLNLTPHHVTKSGGPGSLTGHLRKAVGGVKRPKRLPEGGYSGGVGVGGPRSLTNIYRKEVEDKYPYMEPGLRKAQPKMSGIWEAAWAKATRR